MAHPGTSSGRQTAMVSLRLDEDLAAQIETWAREQGVSRSTAMRVLIGAALGEAQKRTVAREVAFVFEAIKKRFVARLHRLVQDRIPEAIEAADREVAQLDEAAA